MGNQPPCCEVISPPSTKLALEGGHESLKDLVVIFILEIKSGFRIYAQSKRYFLFTHDSFSKFIYLMI